MLYQNRIWKISATGMVFFTSIFTSTISIAAEEGSLRQSQVGSQEYIIAQRKYRNRRYIFCLRRAETRRERRICRRRFGKNNDKFQ